MSGREESGVTALSRRSQAGMRFLRRPAQRVSRISCGLYVPGMKRTTTSPILELGPRLAGLPAQLGALRGSPPLPAPDSVGESPATPLLSINGNCVSAVLRGTIGEEFLIHEARGASASSCLA
jgi:hypothetical protein